MKHYEESSLLDVINDQNDVVRQLSIKAKQVHESAENKFNGGDGLFLKEKVLFASVFVKEFECDIYPVHQYERRVYEDALRSIEHANRTMQEAIDKIRSATICYSEALEKIDIAVAVVNHKNKS